MRQALFIGLVATSLILAGCPETEGDDDDDDGDDDDVGDDDAGDDDAGDDDSGDDDTVPPDSDGDGWPADDDCDDEDDTIHPDADGAAEVVYADELTLWVYDGSTGTVVFQDDYHSSGTVFEYPVIADVDGDGNAEIVLNNDGYTADAHGVQVFGDLADEWVGARTVWNQKAYYITNIGDDLTIPTNAAPNWPTYNNFRQGAPGSFDPLGAPNLTPYAHGPCQAGAGDPVDLLVQVANDGVVLASASLELAVYGEDAGGVRTLLETVSLADPLLPGMLSAPFTFTHEVKALAGFERLVAVVDEPQDSNECDEGDNEAEVDLATVQP